MDSGSADVGSRRNGGRSCPAHATKRGDLYCLTCEVVVCSECLIGSRGHARHSIDTVRDTYAGRFQETRLKVEMLNSHIRTLRRNAEKFFTVLETIRHEETSILERLDRLVVDAKAEVVGSSKKYAEQLEPLLLTTRLKSHNRDRIVSKIASLSEGEFLMQQTDIDKQCDGLMGSMYSIPELLDESDSVTCSLLPTIEMHSYELKLEGQSIIPLSYVDRYSIKWYLQLERTNKLTLHLDTKELDGLRGCFLFLLDIPDKLALKKIKLSVPFTLPDASASDQITKVLVTDLSQFQKKGLLTEDDPMRISLGIGPQDPISERNCYDFVLLKYRKKVRSLRGELVEWKTYNIGHFVMDNCPPLGSKKAKTLQSSVMVDENGVRWQLKITINGKGNKGFVGATLFKCTPKYEGWYDFFIELLHLRSEQQNRIFRGCYQFDTRPAIVLPQFMAVVFLDQFQDKGTLRFRFGMKREK